jgi:hypothetical protein
MPTFVFKKKGIFNYFLYMVLKKELKMSLMKCVFFPNDDVKD